MRAQKGGLGKLPLRISEHSFVNVPKKLYVSRLFFHVYAKHLLPTMLGSRFQMFSDYRIVT